MEESDAAWTTFSTSLGVCGVRWTVRGIDSFFLPEASGTNIERRLKEITENARSSSALPTWVRELIRKVKAHLRGQAQDFSEMPLDFVGISGFRLSVYQAAQKVP